MNLSEKILRLRTARGMSQGDLAEQLEVSRQSVSKWETGQSIPDLDKIIKLADLFGLSVDELVREREAPKSQPERPTQQVIYVEQEKHSDLTVAQILGIVLEVSGTAIALLGLIGELGDLVLFSPIPVILGLPLLLVKKRPVPETQAGTNKLGVFQVCGTVLALFGLLLTAMVAVSASRGQIGHIELVFVLLLVLPGAVLALAPKHNLLAMAWTLWSGSFVICMLGDTSLLLWLKKFYLMFFLGDSGPVQISVMGGVKTGLFWLHALLLCLLVVRTWETWKKEHGETGRDG